MGLLVFLPVALWASQPPANTSPRMVLDDSRLELRLFASEPQIATPIGIATDQAGRVFVLESHTHVQGADYRGPRGDRIKVFTDADRDGTPERVSIFADSIEDGMNIAFSPSGELCVVTSRSVLVLHDRDADGVSEGRTRVLHMVKPQRVYDHAALMGLTFSSDGWLYVSRGNTGGAAWRIEGTDGSAVSGYGDGGNVIRCRPDGTAIEQVATGFWNPFDIKFDLAGRLLALDNDPDSRGPNRLVHVIRGGDYGYKSLYGGSGLHPYSSWNGELPGTLPYAAAIGEAPAGMLVAGTAALPEDYRQDLLAAIWEERSIVRIRLTPKGSSVTGTVSRLVQGDETFHPVAFAADPHGTVYFTDWVVRAYPNHGKGRVWRLTTERGTEVMQPGVTPANSVTPPIGMEALDGITDAHRTADVQRVRDAVLSDDPFVRSAGVSALSHAAFRSHALAFASGPDPRVRLAAVLALRLAGRPGDEPIARRLLDDPDPDVRRMTLVWIGTAGMSSLEPVIDRALTGTPSPQMFEAYLATLEQLGPEFVQARKAEAQPYARLLKRVLRPRFLESFILDPRRPDQLRAMAVAYLEQPESRVPFLAQLAAGNNSASVRLEAVRTLATLTDERVGPVLDAIVRDSRESAVLRAEALSGLARQSTQPTPRIRHAITLVRNAPSAVRIEAARYLRTVRLDAAARTEIQNVATRLTGPHAPAVKAQLGMAIPALREPAQTDSVEWDAKLAGRRGDPQRGRRVFFSAPAACSHCHAAERRGGSLGPDLTNVGQSKTRRQVLHAILDPSAEISPEYQGWFVRTATNEIHTGRQIDVGDDGKAELFVAERGFITIAAVREYGPMPRSLMPDGLHTNLTVDDMSDLLAFLKATR